MKSSADQLRKRGYIKDSDITPYLDLGKDDLLSLLDSRETQKRTIAAHLLRNFHQKEMINLLCSKLADEKKLYTKLKICETLQSMGKRSAVEMVKYLGRIGNNQHKDIPDSEFKKKSFPLPRDIIARTLAHMNKEILPVLIKVLKGGDIISIREAIDAIGFICFYNPSNLPVDSLLEIYEDYNDDKIIPWKVIRALQSFDDPLVFSVLMDKKTKEKNIKIKKEIHITLKRIKGRKK